MRRNFANYLLCSNLGITLSPGVLNSLQPHRINIVNSVVSNILGS